MSGKQVFHSTDNLSFESPITTASPPGSESDKVMSKTDDAYAVYKGSNVQELDPTEAKRVLRKIDWRIVPILFGT